MYRHIKNIKGASLTKWSNTLKQFVFTQTLRTNRLSVFDHFVGLALKGLTVSCVTRYHYFLVFITQWI